MKIAHFIILLVLACLDLAKASSSKAAKANSANTDDAKAKIGAQHIIAPFKCPGSCVVGEMNSDGVLEANVRLFTAADNDSYSDQVLIVHETNMLTKLESATHEGQCVGVIEGTPESEGGMCGGRVGFISCELPAAQWYFTGGQFLSAACWALELSSVLDVDEGCSALGVRLATDYGNVVVNLTTLTQTFMLLEPPKFIQEKMGAMIGETVIYHQCDYGGGKNNGYKINLRPTCYPKREDGEYCESSETNAFLMCISNICEHDKCICSACSGTGDYPGVPWYCYEGACRDKRNNGELCGVGNDCKSNRCYQGTCRDKLNNGEDCNSDNDCKSNNCSFWSWYTCK